MILLPVGHDEPSVRRLPWVTFSLMTLCVLAFLISGRGFSGSGASVALRSDALLLWGLVPDQTAPLTLLTHMFLHVGWLHLIGNLLILYLAGPFIEDLWGRPLFAAFYLSAGLAGAVCHIAGNAGANVPMVGASGAIAGVMGAFMVRYGTTRIRFFFLVLFVGFGTFSVPAWILLPFWFTEQLVWAVLEAGSGVAYWAHVGGFAFGVVGALLIRSVSAERRWIEPALRVKIDPPLLDNASVERGLAIHAEGHTGQALARLRHAVESQPENPDAARALWSVAVAHGVHERVAPLLLRSIVKQLRSGDPGPALDLWGDILQHLPEVRAETSVLLSIGGLLAEKGRNAEARSTLGRAMRLLGPDTPAAYAFRLARTAEGVDPFLALSAVELSLSASDLDPGSRLEAEALRERLTPIEVPVEGP